MRKRNLRRAAFGLAALAAVAALLQLYGLDRMWARSGPADLGDVDFATLVRRDTPNDALACGEGLCAATADIAAPVLDLPAAEALARVEAALSQEPRLEQVAKDAERGALRYVQRSLLFRFPDTINVQVVALPEGRSSVLIYSRSQIGRGDMGVNRARVARWAGLIEAQTRK